MSPIQRLCLIKGMELRLSLKISVALGGLTASRKHLWLDLKVASKFKALVDRVYGCLVASDDLINAHTKAEHIRGFQTVVSFLGHRPL